MVEKLTAKEAYRILKARGLESNPDTEKTYFAINREAQEIYEFESLAERDFFVSRRRSS